MSALKKIGGSILSNFGAKGLLKSDGRTPMAMPRDGLAPAMEAAKTERTRAQSRSSARRSGGVKLLMSPSRGPAGGDTDGQTTLGVKGTLKS
jgi:hypothetical protein